MSTTDKPEEAVDIMIFDPDGARYASIIITHTKTLCTAMSRH